MAQTQTHPARQSSGVWLGLAGGLAVAALAGAILEIGGAAGLHHNVMLRDPAAEFGIPILAGSLTFLGAALLLICAAVTAFAASLGVALRGLLTLVSAFSLVLALDDQFMLHERVIPDRLGLPEDAVMAIYGLMGLVVVILAARVLPWRQLLGLIPALAFLTISVIIDLDPLGVERSRVLEDLTKLAGFGAWLAFWAGLAYRQCQEKIAPL